MPEDHSSYSNNEVTKVNLDNEHEKYLNNDSPYWALRVCNLCYRRDIDWWRTRLNIYPRAGRRFRLSESDRWVDLSWLWIFWRASRRERVFL